MRVLFSASFLIGLSWVRTSKCIDGHEHQDSVQHLPPDRLWNSELALDIGRVEADILFRLVGHPHQQHQHQHRRHDSQRLVGQASPVVMRVSVGVWCICETLGPHTYIYQGQAPIGRAWHGKAWHGARDIVLSAIPAWAASTSRVAVMGVSICRYANRCIK